ncbi:MAG: tRNA 4-thiouridine(8) synthase ThiI [Deltaproteobacteria bacterium]|nr:tRNA 4-thiouridine(8) synthase ThiI [Deltaproteobacteria bacterium]
MKAISIFSGGLDSILATLLVKESGIEVLPVFFSTPFFTPEKALESAEKNNLPLKIIDITDQYFPLLKRPKHGFGGNMNPCIDCHALMIRLAGKMLEDEKADFIVSGEVLGQRPMSQNMVSLSRIEKESEMKGLILRPLSAKLLPKTVPVINGWINEKSLLNFSGRSRKPQIALARKYNIKDYPHPGGGCLLTDPIFCKKLKDLMDNSSELNKKEIEFLKLGRHFRFTPDTKIVVGRNQNENEQILSLAGQNGYYFHTITNPGPVVYVSGRRLPETDMLAASITASYSDQNSGEIEIALNHNGRKETLKVEIKDKGDFRNYMI